MVCEFFKCYQKEAIILFHKHGVSPITVGLFLCCCTGFVKYLISNNSVAELRSLKKIIIDWGIFWATYSSCWEQSCTGFCTAGLIIWQFVHITFQTFDAYDVTTLKNNFFFFFPSFCMCFFEAPAWICQKNGEIEYRSCLQGEFCIQTPVSLNANCNQKGQESVSLSSYTNILLWFIAK